MLLWTSIVGFLIGFLISSIVHEYAMKQELINIAHIAFNPVHSDKEKIMIIKAIVEKYHTQLKEG